jgi:hypothetical protein
MSSCEHDNEPSGSVKGGVFLDQLRDYQRVCVIQETGNIRQGAQSQLLCLMDILHSYGAESSVYKKSLAAY